MSTTYTNPNSEKPLTATKPAREAKKRGRQGSNVISAFAAIPSEPTPAVEFGDSHNVSLHVLRQAKRFDRTNLTGVVHVKKDKSTGVLMIWRADTTTDTTVTE